MLNMIQYSLEIITAPAHWLFKYFFMCITTWAPRLAAIHIAFSTHLAKLSARTLWACAVQSHVSYPSGSLNDVLAAVTVIAGLVGLVAGLGEMAPPLQLW